MDVAPRGFGECLNAWFGALGRNWKPLLALSVFSHIPVGILVVVAFLVTGAHESFMALSDPETVERLSRDEFFTLMWSFAWGLGAWTFAQAIAGIFLYLAVARIVVTDLVAPPAEWRPAAREAVRRLASALGAALLILTAALMATGLAIGLIWLIIYLLGVDFLSVFLAAVIGLSVTVAAIWLLLSVAFSPQAIATEDIGAVGSLRRSHSLVQRRWWATVGFLFVTSIIASGVGQLLGLISIPFFVAGFAVTEMMAVAYGVIAVLQGVVIAAVATAYAIWYLDLRSRMEPLTTEQLV